jgi:hypothetical protein
MMNYKRYRFNFYWSSLDINECLSRPCHVNGVCNNSPGTYTCTCQQGYDGDGVVRCDGTYYSVLF